MLAYAKTKPARDGLKAQKTEKPAAPTGNGTKAIYHSGRSHPLFRAHGVSKLPSHKALQAEIERLTAEKNAHYNEYREKRARVKELHTVKAIFLKSCKARKTERKSTNMSVKNRPETIPKRGYALHPIRNTAHL